MRQEKSNASLTSTRKRSTREWRCPSLDLDRSRVPIWHACEACSTQQCGDHGLLLCSSRQTTDSHDNVVNEMTAKRDSSLFPAGSIGRTQGTIIARNASHESLTAHPLLSPTAPASSGSSISSVASSIIDPQSPVTPVAATRYVPYTPRQRGTPASATTGAVMHSNVQASPHAHSQHGDATSKLQLMNLKAAAQKGGLEAASTGWAILEKLGTETDHGPEWNEIWSAITTSKVSSTCRCSIYLSLIYGRLPCYYP